ncbi:MAG: potassium channel family protein, partial [Planctomycetota bacterium]
GALELVSASLQSALNVPIRRRARVLGLITAMMVAHIVEVWIFGLTYWVLDGWPTLGRLDGPVDEGALDFIYFSVTSFTTLGFGDIVPTGAIRILCGAEALAGLSLITWSASFAFLEMQRDWAEFRRPTDT